MICKPSKLSEVAMNGERIKLARKRAGLSLRALAHKMNDAVTAQAIGKYERNEMTPSSEVLIKLTEVLDVRSPAVGGLHCLIQAIPIPILGVLHGPIRWRREGGASQP